MFEFELVVRPPTALGQVATVTPSLATELKRSDRCEGRINGYRYLGRRVCAAPRKRREEGGKGKEAVGKYLKEIIPRPAPRYECICTGRKKTEMTLERDMQRACRPDCRLQMGM